MSRLHTTLITVAGTFPEYVLTVAGTFPEYVLTVDPVPVFWPGPGVLRSTSGAFHFLSLLRY